MDYPLKKLLVCIDMSAFDDTLIAYAAMFAKTIKAERIYFIHVVRSLEIPEKLKEEFPEMTTPLDESLINKIKPKIEKHISEDDISYQIGIKEGNVTENILKWSKIKQVDLILMGRKQKSQGSGVNPTRIANISLCSVLIVPKSPPLSIKNIFAPIDFSLYSKRAISRSLTIRASESDKIFLQNVYRVPSGYHYTGKTYQEFANIMEENAKNDFKIFLKKYDLNAQDFEFSAIMGENDDPADLIFQEAKKVNSELIIIGSRGRTTAASLLLGSVAIALLRYNFEIPCFIVKNKNENMGFFQALMQI